MSEIGEIFINKAKTCAVTGHRFFEKPVNKKVINSTFKKLITQGFDTFLVGMALGFDTDCFSSLLKLKKTSKIQVIACIPFDGQADNFPQKDREKYYQLLEKADEKIYISHNYNSYCMQKRNKFMVDNCSVLIAYLKRDFGGTFNTVKYAEKKGVEIIRL